MRLRSHLAALVLAVLVPMVVFTAIVMVVFGRQQRAAVERGAVEIARALMNAVDEHLHGTITTLEALATARSLDTADLGLFHADALRVLASQPDWQQVILLTPAGGQLINTLRPFGEPLPPAAEPASVAEVVASRRPVVGDVARGRFTALHAVPVRVPVIRRGRVVHVLTAAVKPESMLAVLTRQRVDPDWVATVFDRRTLIVARTRSFSEFLGRPVSSEFVTLLGRGAAEGWAVTHTLEGRPVYTAYARSPLTGWGIGIGIPTEDVDAPLRRSLYAIGAGGLAFAVVALGLAVLVGRRLTAPMAVLAAAARHFGAGGALRVDAPARVDEVEEVRQAFVGAAELVRQRAEEAEAAARAKDQFLAVLSHELRTPLNAVYGWARMLQGGQMSAEQAARALDVIVRQSNAQVQLIDDLLDVSRVITGKMRLDVRPVDLTAVVGQVLDAVRPAADAKDIRIVRELDPHAGPVMGDAARLQQVVWNLVMNAVKFTPTGGRVTVRLVPGDAHAEIVVSDTGPGIAPDLLPVVFERFRQADSSSTRAHTGLGLGLALVKHLVELHGGTVAAQSGGADPGATFVVRLPLGGAPPRRPAALAPPAEADGVARARLDGVRVLVVDDDREALDLAVAVLAPAGALVRVATSASEGLDTLRAWRPDVLVSDIEMPGEDGYRLIRNVRALPDAEGGRTPAVALTAYGRSQDRVASLSAGYTMHVPKPVDPGELTSIVAAVAGRQPQL